MKKLRFLSAASAIMLMLSGNVFSLSSPTSVGGDWVLTENGCKGGGKALGDCFYMFEDFINTSVSTVFSCDFTFDGHAVGLVIAVDKNAPANDWYCINYETSSGIARLFHVRNGSLLTSCPVALTESSLSKAIHSFRIVCLAGSNVSFYADDLFAGSIPCSELTGGYAGVMTCQAVGEFTNIIIVNFAAPALESVEFVGVELSPAYSASSTEFLAYVPYETASFKIKATFPEGLNVKIRSSSLKSGEEKDVKLSVGCNQIVLEVSSEVSGQKLTSTQYLIIHRAQSDEFLYNEDYRPYFHYSSKAEWINDPNGLCYDASTGLYHMFYQTRPRTSVADANQCWYHAVSSDLIHWEQLDPALVPDSLGFCWSGSGNIDRFNTSGLFPEDSDPESRIVLAFSSVYGDSYYGVEKISLAYTPDGGKTWLTYDGNPIIKNGENYVQQYTDGFRDPKLLWFEDASYKNGGVWLMLVGGGQGRIFSSENLLDWKFESAMTDRDGSPLSGECPDFFRIKVEGTEEQKWVYMRGCLDLSTDPQTFQTQPVVGELYKNADGIFVFDVERDTKQVMYEGNIMYATQSFCNAPDGRVIQLSWCREWLGITGYNKKGSEVKDFNGLMSLPLELKLYRINGEYVFKSYPCGEVDGLRGETIFKGENISVIDTTGKFYEIDAEVVLNASDSTFTLRSGKSGAVTVTFSDYDEQSGSVLVTADGTHSGKYNGIKSSVTAMSNGGILKLRIYVDANSVDVFCGDGEKSVVILAYPEPDNVGLTYSGAELKSVSIYELTSCFAASEAEPSDTENTVDTVISEPSVTEAETKAPAAAPNRKKRIIPIVAIGVIAVSAACAIIIKLCKKKK